MTRDHASATPGDYLIVIMLVSLAWHSTSPASKNPCDRCPCGEILTRHCASLAQGVKWDARMSRQSLVRIAGIRKWEITTAAALPAMWLPRHGGNEMLFWLAWTNIFLKRKRSSPTTSLREATCLDA